MSLFSAVFVILYFCYCTTPPSLLTCVLSHRICEAAKSNGLLEQELAHAVNAASHAINKTHPKFPEVSKRPDTVATVFCFAFFSPCKTVVKRKTKPELLSSFVFFFQSLTRHTAIEVASTVKALYNETESLLLGRVSLVSFSDSLLCTDLIIITFIFFFFI